MNYVSHFLLFMMLLSYSIPIGYICYYYSKNKGSVSSIINSDECQRFIFVGMIIMGLFTILYELNREKSTIYVIIMLLIGIYGVILVKENDKIHYFFASLVFLSINGFMIFHCYHQYCNDFLNFLLYIQFIFSILLLLFLVKCNDILFCEGILIINFAIYYLFLHFL
jgi:hypothetical protein